MCIVVDMHPLSFAEFMSVYSGTKQDGWNEYMLYGGLPLIMNISSPEEKINFLKLLFEETGGIRGKGSSNDKGSQGMF